MRSPVSDASHRRRVAISRFTSLERLPGKTTRTGASVGNAEPLTQGFWVARLDPIEFLGQRMADIAARGTSEPPMRFGFEGQNAEDMVHITAHAPCAPRAPSPDARRDIIDNGDLRRLAAHALGDLMGEFGTVENDEDVRIEIDHGGGTLPDRLKICRSRGSTSSGLMTASSVKGNIEWRPCASMNSPPTPFNSSGRDDCALKRLDQFAAESIAGMLAGDQEDLGRARVHEGLLLVGRPFAPEAGGATPTMKMPSRLARRITSSRSAISTSPAATAMPVNPCLRHAAHRLRPNRRKIDPTVLSGLCAFHQDADTRAAATETPFL